MSATKLVNPSRSFGRRSLLRAFASAAMVSPFMGGLATQIANAQEGVGRARFYFMFTGNGIMPHHWVPPSGGETDFTLAPALAPLQALKQKVILVRGLLGANNHSGGMSETTTGRPTNDELTGRSMGGPSIDQAFAGIWKGSTPLSSLETGVFPSSDSNQQTSYAPSGVSLPAIGSPVGAFNRVYGLTNEPAEVAEARRRRQRSLLDATASEIKSIQGRIGPQSRHLLDEHLSIIRAQELELQKPYVPIQCSLPAAPTTRGQHIGEVWKAHHDTIAAAFRCGTTRVASLRAGGWGGTQGYNAVGLSEGHHNVSHGGTSDPDGDSLGIERWHCEQFAYLAGLLDAIPEGDGTMLDHTVLVWFSELGLGPVNYHGRADLPVVIAGGSRLGFKTGRYHNIKGGEYQNILYTLARGIGGPSFTSFGTKGKTLLTQLLT